MDLAALTSINTSGYESPVSIEADGAGSVVDVSALTTYAVSTSYSSSLLSVTNSGKVDLNSGLTSLNQVNLTLDGTGTIPIGQFTSITDATITIEGGDYATGTPLANLTDIDGSSLTVYGGGSLALPGVSAYKTTNTTTFQAYGQSSTYPYTATVGTISLPALTSITGAVNVYAQGTGSEIDLPLVTSLGGGSLSVTQSGTVKAPLLTALSGVSVTLDGTGTIATAQWQSLTHGTLTIAAGDYSSTASPPFASLSDIDYSNLYVYGGGSLALPAVTSDTSYYNTFQAYQPYYYNKPTVGTIGLPALASITGAVNLYALGTGSEIDLPLVTALGGGSLSVTQSGTVKAPLLTALTGVSVTLDGTGTIATSQWQSLTHGTLYITAGDYSSTASPPFANLSDIDYSNLYVYGGGSLALPAVTSDTVSYNTFQAYQSYYSTTVGTIGLPALASITGAVNLYVQGAGSEIDLPLADRAGRRLVERDPERDDQGARPHGAERRDRDAGRHGHDRHRAMAEPHPQLADDHGRRLFLHVLAPVRRPERHHRFQPLRVRRRQPRAARGDQLHGLLQHLPGRIKPTTAPTVGTISLPALTTIGGNNLAINVYGQGSEVDMPALLSWNAPGSALSVTNHGTVQDNGLAALNQITVTLDGTGTIPTAPWTSFTEQQPGDHGGTVHVQPAQGPPQLLDRGQQRRGRDADGLDELFQPERIRHDLPPGQRRGQRARPPGADQPGDGQQHPRDPGTPGRSGRCCRCWRSITNASPYVQIEADGTAPWRSGSLVNLSLLAELLRAIPVTPACRSPTAPRRSIRAEQLHRRQSDPRPDRHVHPDAEREFHGHLRRVARRSRPAPWSSRAAWRSPTTRRSRSRARWKSTARACWSLTPAATLKISGDLTGNTTNADRFTPLGTVVFDGGGGTGSPQHLEAMSADLGAVQAGSRTTSPTARSA